MPPIATFNVIAVWIKPEKNISKALSLGRIMVHHPLKRHWVELKL